jgi:hypothetical protein
LYLRNARLGSLHHGWIGALATATISVACIAVALKPGTFAVDVLGAFFFA